MKLSQKINLAVSLLSTLIVLCVGITFFTFWISSLKWQLGQEALDISIAISHNNIISEYLVKENGYIKIQNYIENLRLKTRIKYIHIINKDGIIFSHPISSLIGNKYNNERALKVLETEESYIQNSGFFAYSTEACSVVYHEGKVAGIIVVGLLNGRVYQDAKNNILKFIMLIFTIVIGGNLIAYFLSKNIKKTIFGLEPVEIASMLGQKEMILENLKEGIVSFDSKGEIDLINKSAEKLLNMEIKTEDLKNTEYSDFFKEGFLKVAETGYSAGPYEFRTSAGFMLLVTFYQKKDSNEKFPGVIASIEDFTLAKRKAEELTGIKQLNFSLRAQNHEFINKLHTISGLIQMQEYDEAVKYIAITSAARGEVLYILGHKVRELSLAGLLLAKYNKASEARILVTIDENSNISKHLSSISSDDLCTIVGNLLENSIDELTGRNDGEIFFSIYENADCLNILIEDNGRGIPDYIKESIFEKGISSKGPDRGYGLYIIKSIIDKLGGAIDVDCKNGCAFNIFIPNKI